MSLISFLGSTCTTTHVISKLYRNPEFTDFLKNINEGESQEVLHKFVKNLTLSTLDPIVIPFLESPENQKTFSNEEELNRFIESMLRDSNFLFWLASNEFHNVTHIRFDVPLANVEQFLVDIKDALLNDVEGLKTATCPTDVYKTLVDHSATTISNIVYEFIVKPSTDQVDEGDVLDAACELFKEFNSCYKYESKVYSEESSRKRDRSNNEQEESSPMDDNKKAKN